MSQDRFCQNRPLTQGCVCKGFIHEVIPGKSNEGVKDVRQQRKRSQARM